MPTHTSLDGRDVIGLYLEQQQQQQQLTSGLIIYLPTFYLLTYLLISGLLIYLLPVYLLIYLLPVYLLPVKYLLIYLLIYFNLMAYGHTPLFSPRYGNFVRVTMPKTTWSVCGGIVMHIQCHRLLNTIQFPTG